MGLLSPEQQGKILEGQLGTTREAMTAAELPGRLAYQDALRQNALADAGYRNKLAGFKEREFSLEEKKMGMDFGLKTAAMGLQQQELDLKTRLADPAIATDIAKKNLLVQELADNQARRVALDNFKLTDDVKTNIIGLAKINPAAIPNAVSALASTSKLSPSDTQWVKIFSESYDPFMDDGKGYLDKVIAATNKAFNAWRAQVGMSTTGVPAPGGETIGPDYFKKLK